MRRIDARLEAAARRSDQLLRISPKSADQRLVSTDQLRPPSPRTKLLTPSVFICRCSNSHEPQRPRHTLSEHIHHVNEIFFVFKNKFSRVWLKVLVSFFRECAPTTDVVFLIGAVCGKHKCYSLRR